ncbi:MAG: DEAD/DEAH box helicase [Planctomycetaceae bacterium]
MDGDPLGIGAVIARRLSGAALDLPAPAMLPRVPVAGLPEPAVARLPVAALGTAVVAVPLLDAPPAVSRYVFGVPTAATRPPVSPPTPAAGPARPRPRRARIAPPADVIRVEERLWFLLQPDIDTLLGSCRLAFPRDPFPFQLEGMAFLVPRHGAVLADEMGLGKSMQAISGVRILLHACGARAVLVVCPKGLVSNWAREFADWAPEIPVAVVEGDPARRRWQWGQADVPVKVANYETVVRDREVVAAVARPFDLVVLDEAQRIKNPSSQTARAVRDLPRRRSWALTGTPVENAAADLVALFEFVAPGQVHERMSPRELGLAAADHVLRRTKDQVLRDLPPRLDRDERIELTAEQRETYRRAEEEGVLRLAGMGAEATIRHVFELVLRLKQICNFDTATAESAKLDRLRADLEEVQASGRKALVFSQWVDTLQRLEGALRPFGPLVYHGGMSTGARDECVRRFRDDPRHSVLLLSYGAGAVGLNLQFSRYVFLFDRWWNPAVEDQAVNRAHRIGAAGAVTVTRYLAAGTIEERIDEVLRRKRDLSETILSGAGTTSGGGLTVEELFALFRLPPPARDDHDRRAA